MMNILRWILFDFALVSLCECWIVDRNFCSIRPLRILSSQRHYSTSSSLSSNPTCSSPSKLIIPLPSPTIKGIYVHIPFCRRRCFYCDFTIEVVGDNKSLQKRKSSEYEKLLQREIDLTVNVVRKREEDLGVGMSLIDVDSIYFGGGTPSLMDNRDLGSLLQSLQTSFRMNSLDSVEVTLEMDPGTFTLSRLKQLISLGINRVSVGIQSLNEKVFTTLGRAHTLDDSYRAIEALQSVSPSSDYPPSCDQLRNGYNLDLISGLPRQTEEIWIETLQKAIQTGCQHLSIYDLQVETKTAFGNWYQPGVFPLPTEEVAARMYTLAVEILSQSSTIGSSTTTPAYEHYEISNYAKLSNVSTSKSSPFRSKHNSKYWDCTPVAAIGLGATSYLGNKRYCRPTKMREYIQWLENAEKNPIQFAEEIGVSSMMNPTSTEDMPSAARYPDLLDIVMCSLRTSNGLSLDHIRVIYSEEIVTKIVNCVSPFIEQGLVEYHRDGWLRLTDPKGFLLSNTVISSIFAALS